MPMAPSPIQGIDAVLGPYIKSRSDALRIRRILAHHLALCTASNADLDLHCPTPTTLPKGRPSTELAGIRLEYVKRIKSNVAARERYNSLKASLHDLSKEHHSQDALPNEASLDQEAARSYVTLVRRRTLLAELETIQASLTKLLDAEPNLGAKDIKVLVGERIGEQPHPPTAQLDPRSHSSHVENLTFGLKTAVIKAKVAMEEACKERATSMGQESETCRDPSLELQVHALRLARDHLIGWVETELAKLSDDASELAEDPSPVKVVPSKISKDGSLSPEKRIEEVYEAYNAVRASLLDTLNLFSNGPSSNGNGNDSHIEPKCDPGPQVNIEDSEIRLVPYLPYIPSLLRASRLDRSLVQQSAYLRQQLITVSTETEKVLSRLSEESHLVSPGSTDPSTWARSALQFNSETNQFAEERLDEAEAAVEQGRTIVREVEERRIQFLGLEAT